MPAFDPPLTTAEVAASFPRMSIVTPLLAGGQGALFRTRHDGSDAVLKVYGAGTELVRVDREVRQLTAINSSYVVRLLGHGEAAIRGRPHRFTLTEFVDGSDLTGTPRTLASRSTSKRTPSLERTAGSEPGATCRPSRRWRGVG